jgi:hypothetical protein
MERRGALSIAVIGALALFHATDAEATGAAYQQGSFARPMEEKALVIWDEAKKTEHLVRALGLKGDAETFGVFIPTPSVPTIAKESDDVIDHVGKLFVPAAGTTATVQRTQLGEYEAVTLKAGDERALGDWLAKNRFVDKLVLRNWVKTYAAKGWYLTAIRSTSKGAGDRQLEIPAIRLSFKADAPVFPYAEAALDDADEAAYRAKYNPHQPYRGYSYGMRLLDVYFVADRQMQMVSGQTTAGPAVADSLRVPSDTVVNALGPTKAWSFDPNERPGWVVTHLSENVWQRTTATDLTFQTYDLPRPRPGPGATELDDRPTGPTYPASSMAWMTERSPSAGPASPHKKRFRVGAIALFLLIAGAVGFAIMSEQRAQKPKP